MEGAAMYQSCVFWLLWGKDIVQVWDWLWPVAILLSAA